MPLPHAPSAAGVRREQPQPRKPTDGGPKAGCSQGVSLVGFLGALAVGIAYVSQTGEHIHFDGPLEHVVGNATAAGVKKFIMPEEHDQPENFNFQTRVMYAVVHAKPQDAPAKLAMEAVYDINNPRDKKSQDFLLKWMTDPSQRQRLADACVSRYSDPAKDGEISTAFKGLVMRPDMSFALMNWLDPDRNDIEDTALDNASFLISDLGFMHGFGTLTQYPNMVGYRFMGPPGLDASTGAPVNMHLIGRSMQSPPTTRAQQKGMFNALARMQKAAPTMLIMSSRIWSSNKFPALANEPGLSPQAVRARFINYYTSKGYAVLEVPVPHQPDAVVLLKQEFMEPLMEVWADHPEIRISLPTK